MRKKFTIGTQEFHYEDDDGALLMSIVSQAPVAMQARIAAALLIARLEEGGGDELQTGVELRDGIKYKITVVKERA